MVCTLSLNWTSNGRLDKVWTEAKRYTFLTLLFLISKRTPTMTFLEFWIQKFPLKCLYSYILDLLSLSTGESEARHGTARDERARPGGVSTWLRWITARKCAIIIIHGLINSARDSASTAELRPPGPRHPQWTSAQPEGCHRYCRGGFPRSESSGWEGGGNLGKGDLIEWGALDESRNGRLRKDSPMEWKSEAEEKFIILCLVIVSATN